MGSVIRISIVPSFFSSAQSFIVTAGIKNRKIHGINPKKLRISAWLTRKKPRKKSHADMPRKNVMKIYAMGELK
jgi:hypothetical protein